MKGSTNEASASGGASTSSTSTAPTRRSGLSCNECRRSKLKCDRTFPCQACIRRGCAAICPDGTLTATKGNKVLAAHAEKLTERNKALTARVKELEKALAEAHNGSLSHSLLGDSQNRHLEGGSEEGGGHWDPKYPAGSSTDVSDLVGSMSVGLDGQRRSSSSDAMVLDSSSAGSVEEALDSLPTEIVHLSNAFPFGISNTPHTTLLFANFIPSREQAARLTDLYYTNAAWFYNPVAEQDFQQSVFDVLYSTTTAPSSTRTSTLSSFHPHSLAVFFLVVATGSLFGEQPFARTVSEQYYALARAAYSLKSVVVESSLVSMQALHMVIIYKYYTERSASNTGWLLGGLSCRIAQTFGLHRNSEGWGLSPEEVQRRRQAFWEMYSWESWHSMILGRPPPLTLEYVDCNFPEDSSPHTTPSGEVELGFHAWKYRYSAACVSVCVSRTLGAQRPSYTSILELDERIRFFPTPRHLQCPSDPMDTRYTWKADPTAAMQQCCVTICREANLMYIHRTFLVWALQDPDDPLKHKYAASVRAAYRSACQLVSTLQSLYRVHPEMASRVWFFWSSLFSACVILAAIVTHKPGCDLGQGAFLELGGARLFFRDCSHNCRPSEESLNAVDKLYERGKSVIQEYQATHVEPQSKKSLTPMGSDLNQRRGSQGALSAAMNASTTTSTGSRSSHQYNTPVSSHSASPSLAHPAHPDPYGPVNVAQSGYPTYPISGTQQIMSELEAQSSSGHMYEMKPPTVPSQGSVLPVFPLDPMYSSTLSHAFTSADYTSQSVFGQGIHSGHHGVSTSDASQMYGSPAFAPYTSTQSAMNVANYDTGERSSGVDPDRNNQMWSGYVQRMNM